MKHKEKKPSKEHIEEIDSHNKKINDEMKVVASVLDKELRKVDNILRGIRKYNEAEEIFSLKHNSLKVNVNKLKTEVNENKIQINKR